MMKQRNILMMFVLYLVTFGIYPVHWLVSTKIEMNKLGAKIPSAWLIIVPLANIWWFWEYAKGAEQITSRVNQPLSTVVSFILLLLLGIIGIMILQDGFNKVSALPLTGAPKAPQPPQQASFQANTHALDSASLNQPQQPTVNQSDGQPPIQQ